MTKRGHGDFLKPHEVEALHRAIRVGENFKALAIRFNISPRTVNLHAAKLEGRARSAGPREDAPSHLIPTTCFVANCESPPQGGSKFCKSHQYTPPTASAPLARLMAGK